MAVNKTAFLKAQKILIAIDWGHGPGTPGKETPYIQSLGRKIQEEEFNIPAAKALATALQAQGFKTMFTADESYDTPLATRVKRANAAGADIFISIHFNAMGHTFGYSTAKGFSAHIQQGMSKTSNAYKLASLMVQELAAGTPQVNRGVVFQPLYVTRWTNMPAVLVELGFMDDPFEAGLMLQKSFHREVAMELTKAVSRYTGIPYSGGAVQAAKPVAREYLMLGDQGAGVRAMQDYYKKAGYKITIDSIFGKDTKAVVVAFQTKHGLKPDGVHGTATAAKLAEVIAALGNPKPAEKIPSYPTAVSDRLGEVQLKADAVYRYTPEDNGKVISTLKKGHKCHYYDIKGHWVRLGKGWVKSQGGSVAEITKKYNEPTEEEEIMELKQWQKEEIMELKQWQKEELRDIYKDARENKKIISSDEHEVAVMNGTLTVSDAVYLNGVLAGAALNDDKRLKQQ